MNSFVSAKLYENNIIKVMIFSELEKLESEPILLIINNEQFVKLNIIKCSYLNGNVIYECHTDVKIKLGNSYYISIKDFGTVPLNVNDCTEFKDFDDKYAYFGDDLGATYFKDHTEFRIWAPLASKVVLLLRKTLDDKFESFVMDRLEKGVYFISIPKDCDGYFYRYKITNSGLTFITTDPYGKGSSANGKDSAVINFDKVNINLNNDLLPYLDSELEAIIYELHIRDFTIDNNTNITHKGKYLGLAEENRRTKGGNPAGLDYLKMLGITHVQILPMYDYKTVDELNPDKSYNWGYDPQQYFTPEGSYSTSPNDPYSRIIELKTMVSALHKAGIKVNMDVVFNHVYDYHNNVFDKVVPNYYFRKTKNGRISNDSFCGDDLDTKRPMVRKMIIDALTFWMKEYGIDGYRFDLLGLMDIETATQAYNAIKSIKSDAMVYGEGWDMAHSLDSNERTSYLNASKVKGIGFFNDSFRDIVKGNNNGTTKGYMAGNIDYLEGFKFVFMGSVVDYCFCKKFDNVYQSLNYVECHDNYTLFDCLKKNNKNEQEILRIIKAINLIISVSYGISFYHAGQEIGLSKKNEDNTYNMGDSYNKFDYEMLDKRYDMALYLSSIIKFKKTIKYNKHITSKYIANNVFFVNLDNGGLMIKLKELGENYKNIIIVINPTSNNLRIELDSYYSGLVLYAGMIENSSLVVKTVFMNPYEVNIFAKLED